MKIGETLRFDCNDCSTEIEVTLEPKMKGKTPSGKDRKVTHCPFCGSSELENPEDDEDE